MSLSALQMEATGWSSPLYFTHSIKAGREMEKLRVYFDRAGNTLTVWFDDPKKEHVCEEADDEINLIKDRRGRVIGFERLNYLSAKQREQNASIPVEVLML